ncbi:MAG TPA: glycoside hydrolase family 97 protein [bacterium]|nr:glycoside hydrolase family 97 protein [bacterium]HPR86885.1 glycoside hydrolase family 97 protein [bacterium]
MKRASLFWMAWLLSAATLSAAETSLNSPDGQITLKVSTGENIRYAVLWHGIEVIRPSEISLLLDNNRHLGEAPRLQKSSRSSVDQLLEPVVRQKSARIRDRYNEMTLTFKGNYSLIFRAYDQGVAWRWVTRFPGRIKVMYEQALFDFASDERVYFGEEPNFYSHQERLYLPVQLKEITSRRQAVAPVLVEIEKGPRVLISEADLNDYPGLWFTGSDQRSTTLVGRFPAVVLTDTTTSDRDVKPLTRAPWIAETSGTRSFPWRLLVLAGRDADLVGNTLVYQLSQPERLRDAAWIKPGKVAWDWWNALNLFDVDFKAGLNTATYKHYIDFAAEYGLDYVILDEGWYPLGNVMAVHPEIDMEELLAHAREKKVGIILWVTWKSLLDQLEPALARFESWGVKGIKVDFMQRDDQWMVNYYWHIAAEAARHHLLVDFHGAYKPAGLERTWPNVLTREGVKGLENVKWSRDVTPEHDVTLPFTRMAVGPMDYTPGAMINATAGQFQPIFEMPMSMTTRCHQMAMYVVYESPLQMLADSPSRYRREPECARFIAGVPTVWDETMILDARIADYVLSARRSGAAWYVGAMTDGAARTLELDLAFLPSGRYSMTLFHDGPNAARAAMDYACTRRSVAAGEKIQLELAPGGGAVAVLSPEK